MESIMRSALDVAEGETEAAQEAGVDEVLSDQTVEDESVVTDSEATEESVGAGGAVGESTEGAVAGEEGAENESSETAENGTEYPDIGTGDASQDSVSSEPDSISGQSGDTVIYETVATVAVEGRPIMSTPINEYTVTEGLLLSILLVLLLRIVWDFAKRFL